jgi:hypothetical protein
MLKMEFENEEQALSFKKKYSAKVEDDTIFLLKNQDIRPLYSFGA